MRSDVVPGATFPDFELTGTDKQRHKLSELQGDDPMVLILSRGHFCPKDHQQHLELASWQSAVAVSYTKIVTICSGNLSDAGHLKQSTGAFWHFLADTRNQVRDELDIHEYTDTHNNPMVPHTLVLEPGLIVYSIYCGYWYWGRPSLHDLRVDLRAVMQKRPDFDPTAQGLREAWDSGDKSKFFPYKG
jgi:peroxiredoxin